MQGHDQADSNPALLNSFEGLKVFQPAFFEHWKSILSDTSGPSTVRRKWICFGISK
jgi:hypothetical protein